MAEDIRTMHEEDEDEVKYCERKRLLFFGLPWTFTKYTITPSMLTIDQGLLKTEENDCYMYKVIDVRLENTLMERNCWSAFSGSERSPATPGMSRMRN